MSFSSQSHHDEKTPKNDPERGKVNSDACARVAVGQVTAGVACVVNDSLQCDPLLTVAVLQSHAALVCEHVPISIASLCTVAQLLWGALRHHDLENVLSLIGGVGKVVAAQV